MSLADKLAPYDDGMYSTSVPPKVKHALIECALALEAAHNADALAAWFTNTDEDGIDVGALIAKLTAALEDQ